MYVYKVTCIPTGEYYFGLRYARDVISYEDDLWKKYFTSSKVIKDRILQYGIHAFSKELIFESYDCTVERLYDIERSCIKANWDDPLMLNKAYHNGALYTRGREVNKQLYTIKMIIRRVKLIRQANKQGIPVKLQEFRKLRNCCETMVKAYKRKPFKVLLGFVDKMERRLAYVPVKRGEKSTLMFRESDNVEMKTTEAYKHVLINLGFVVGRNPNIIADISEKVGKTMRNRIYVHNSKEEKFVDTNDVEMYISNGWSFGRLPSIVDRIRETSEGRPQKQQARDKISAAQKGRHYYTSPDGSVTKSFCIENLHLVPHGWIRGNKLLHRVDKIQRSRNANRVKNKENRF